MSLPITSQSILFPTHVEGAHRVMVVAKADTDDLTDCPVSAIAVYQLDHVLVIIPTHNWAS
jgi:hypothetical protein